MSGRNPPVAVVVLCARRIRFRQSSKYNSEKVTAPNTGVVEGIHYFVAPGFRQQYGGTREKLRRVSVPPLRVPRRKALLISNVCGAVVCCGR